MNDAPRTNEDRLYDLGERYGKGTVKFRCDQNKAYYMNKRPFYAGYVKGVEQAIKEAEEEEMHSTVPIKSAMQKESTMQKCKHCESKNIYMQQNNMHIEVRCADCNKWNKFVGEAEKNNMLLSGIEFRKTAMAPEKKF